MKNAPQRGRFVAEKLPRLRKVIESPRSPGIKRVPMARSPISRAGVGLAVMVVFTALVVVTSRSQQGSARSADPVPGQPIAMPSSLVGLEIDFGQSGEGNARWQGEVRVSEGRVVSVDVVQGALTSRVDGARFTVKAKVKAKVAKKKQQATALPPVLQVLLDVPRSASVTLDTGLGAFTVPLAELPLGTPRGFLAGRVFVERNDASVRLTGRETEDDFPAGATAPDGTIWVARRF
jgi:hypothetical protein